MLDQLTITLTSAINAEGRIKYYSILRGCSYFLPLPISLFLFSFRIFTLLVLYHMDIYMEWNRQSHHSILCT